MSIDEEGMLSSDERILNVLNRLILKIVCPMNDHTLPELLPLSTLIKGMETSMAAEDVARYSGARDHNQRRGR